MNDHPPSDKIVRLSSEYRESADDLELELDEYTDDNFWQETT